VWSLRELAHTLIGPQARVVSVSGTTRPAIDPAAWADASRIRSLHTSRRGTLKFRWRARRHLGRYRGAGT